jgi:hypothetical protein
MTASLQSPADLVNAALAGLKSPLRIGTLYDGSAAAKKALDIYGQARDWLLRGADWGFPRGDAALTLVKAAPPGGYNPATPWDPTQHPPIPYLFEYAYPPDCLMLRSVQPAPLFLPDFTPSAAPFEIANDTVKTAGQPAAPGRVILCYLAAAVGTYTRQVTDMSQWDVGFVDALVREIRARIGPALEEIAAGAGDAEKLDTALAQGAGATAAARQG